MPHRIEGTLVCVDIESMHEALYETPIDLAGNFAINPVTFVKHRVPYFVIEALSHEGQVIKYNLTDFRVRRIALNEITEEGKNMVAYTITFYAEYQVS